MIDEYIKKAKTGDQAAFSFLLDTFWNDIYLFQLQRTQNEYEAEEICIETFSKAFTKISSYNNEYKFKTWLFNISKNTHIDRIRKQKKEQNNRSIDQKTDLINKIIDQQPSPEDLLIRQQNLEALLLHIKQLKPEYRKIIHLRFFMEMSYKEICTEIDEPMNNVKVKLLRAKKLLLNSLKNKKTIG